MKMFKLSLVFVMVIILNSYVFSQSKNEEEDQSYGGIEIPGYISANLSLTYGSVRGNYFINSLVLDGKSNDYMLPELDVEVGIVDRLSLEVITGYRKIVSTASATSTKLDRSIKVNKTSDGLNTIMLGANLGIMNEHKYRPGMYFQNQFYLPKVGYSNFQNEQLAYFGILNLESTVSDVTYFDYNVGAGWDGSTPYPIYSFNISPNFYITDNILAYADFGGIYAKYDEPVNLFDIGTTIFFNDNFSVDAYIGNQLQAKNYFKNTYGALKFTYDFNAFAK
jgi:hypothetical protein